MNNYYVYEWIRLDTNEPFYVGKGKNDRWKKMCGRNKWFNNIVNKVSVAVNILHDNLDEQTANEYEVYYIWQYRDIIGYPMCNIQDGGEGHGLPGELNGMYGKSVWDYLTENEKEKRKERMGNLFRELWKKEEYRNKIIESHKGENNYGYGKHPSEEARRKMSEAKKGKYCGEKHPMYGRCGEKSPRSKKVICLTTGRKFNTVKEGSLFYRCNEGSTTRCCKNQLKMSGKLNGEPLVWMYLEDYEKADREQVLSKVSWSKEKREYRGKNNPCAKSVICLTTKRIFFTAKEASEYYNCGSHIPGCCRGERNYSGKLPDGTKLRWRYLTWKHNKTYRIK